MLCAAAKSRDHCPRLLGPKLFNDLSLRDRAVFAPLTFERATASPQKFRNPESVGVP
jgi:hypothetical protein